MIGVFKNELQIKINLTSHFSEVTEELQMFLAPRLSFNYNDFLNQQSFNQCATIFKTCST